MDIRRFSPFQANKAYLSARTTETLGLLYAMHWPHRQPETARGARRSILHDRLAAAGAVFGEAAGWERPQWYAQPGEVAAYEYAYGRQNWHAATVAEHRAVREAVGLFDQSSFGKFLVQGRDACAVLNRLGGGEMDVAVGRVVYTQWLNPRGGIEADLTITRLGAAEFLVVTGAASHRHDLHHLRAHIDAQAHCFVTDVTSGYAVLGLMGPLARAVLAAVTPDDVADAGFPFRSSREIEIGFARVLALRISYVGELGWELYIPTEFAPDVFDRIVAAGAAHGLRLAGFHAMNALRLEKAYRHWGHDIDSETTPLEAGPGLHHRLGQGRRLDRARGVAGATCGGGCAAGGAVPAGRCRGDDVSRRADLARWRAGRAHHRGDVRANAGGGGRARPDRGTVGGIRA